MSKAIVLAAAEADMKEAYEWYEAKNPELAMQFMLCVRQTVDAVEKSPLRFPVSVQQVRKAPVKKFPYSVSYITDGDSIVIACLHDRRDKKIVLERLRSLGPSLQSKTGSRHASLLFPLPIGYRADRLAVSFKLLAGAAVPLVLLLSSAVASCRVYVSLREYAQTPVAVKLSLVNELERFFGGEGLETSKTCYIVLISVPSESGLCKSWILW